VAVFSFGSVNCFQARSRKVPKGSERTFTIWLWAFTQIFDRPRLLILEIPFGLLGTDFALIQSNDLKKYSPEIRAN
jgi:hypothetical protein